jgi:hypothetical protein
MRRAFWSVPVFIAVVGGMFLSGIVLPRDREEASAPNPSVAEGRPDPQPSGWSCDGSNWLFFDRECGGRRRHKHQHRLIIAADGKKSVEARRDRGSALESSPASLKSVQISLNDELKTKPEAQADAHGNRPEHKRASHPRTARNGEPPPIPPAVYGYYVYAAAPVRGRSR